MIRSALVKELANQFDQLTLGDCEAAVTTVLAAISDAMKRGYRIEIRGFGSFAVFERKPRMGRNPRSGERVLIPGRRDVRFKPAKKLREGLSESLSSSGQSTLQ